MKEQELRDNQELVIPQWSVVLPAFARPQKSLMSKTNILICCKELIDMQLGNNPLYLMATPSEQHSFYDSLIANNLPYRPYPARVNRQ